MLYQILMIALLVFGFGFVIFFHELGHFLAAKYVGIKVEQFAVGFGQAMFSWRKGMGITWGSSGRKYEELIAKKDQSGTDVNQIGETEYRLNWIPLGGYVKMLGQDDLKPNATADDPRAYNKKSIGARMLVVSAGVVMNVILAAIGFMVVFLIGFDAPPAVVGGVMSNSPAQKAGLQVGDHIIRFDGKYQHDFTKITLYPALVEANTEVPIEIERVDGTRVTKQIAPERMGGDSKAFLMLGIEQPRELAAPLKLELPDDVDPHLLYSADMLALGAGEVITRIEGQAVNVDEYYKLDRALQQSNGKPVQVTVRDRAGAERQLAVQPRFANSFSKEPLNFAGLLPRPAIVSVSEDSPAVGKLLPGDVVLAIAYENGERTAHPSIEQLTKRLSELGQSGQSFGITVLRDGQVMDIEGLRASVKVAQGRYGLGVGLDLDAAHSVVADVLDGSTPAALASIPAGVTITSMNDQRVENWFDIQRVLAAAQPNTEITLVAQLEGGDEKTYSLKLSKDQRDQLSNLRYTHALLLRERIVPRKTSNPLEAAAWGVVETRDFILQFYLTLQRMFQGSVSYTNMMGPVGIFHAGTKFAFKGMDWLIWFLSMISANLAVVNFLPIPIVDGGLFTFLIIEKIQGRPVSPRTQAIAQVVGLALILGVFLLVTYQDIARFL